MSYHNFPFATREVNNLSKPARSSYPQHIKKMLLQVSRTISQFLENLSYIYKSNGINFKIKQYHGVLMRMLSPFELLTHFGFEQNEKLFLKTHDADKFIRSWSKFESPVRMEENDDFPEDYPKVSSTVMQDAVEQLTPIKEEYQEPMKYINHDNSLLNFEGVQEGPKIIGREPVLGLDAEIRLCEWIKAQVATKKRLVTGPEIGQQAISLANTNRFIASKGWLRRFMGRHPEIQKLLDISRSKSSQQTRRLDGRVNSIIFNEEEKDNNKLSGMSRQADDRSQISDWYRAHNIYQMSESGEQRQKMGNFDNDQLDSEKEDFIKQQPEVRKLKLVNPMRIQKQQQKEGSKQKQRQDKQKLGDERK